MDNNDRTAWQVLLVDDDKDDYLLTRDMLRQAQGRKIVLVWAPTYLAGVECLQTSLYDAVLVDYDLGLQTGIEFIREMNSKGCRAPLILYTGRGSYAVDLEAMQAGATLYLPKGETNPLLLERSIRYAIELKRSKQERIDILESIQDGFFAIDRDWRITFINHRAAQNGGYEPEELTGRNLWEAFPRLLGTPIEENYRLVMDERKAVKFEMQGVYQKTWYTVNVYPFHDGISVYWQDNTERKEIEEDLRLSEERFSKAFNATPNALVISRLRDGMIETVNESFVRLFGYSRADVAGKTSLELNMFAQPDARAEIVKQLRADPSLSNLETDIRLRTGEIRRAQLSIERLTIRGEKYLLTVLEDITERKQAEEALRQNEEVLRLALSAGRAGAWSWDLTTGRIHWSDDYYRIFGYEPGSVEPSPEAGLSSVHPEDLAAVESAVQAAIEQGKQIDIVHRVIRPDGSIHWVRGLAQAFYKDPGKPYRMAGIAIDITGQKQAEIEIATAHQRTAEILESISDAFYSLDTEGRFSYVNQKAASLWGMQPDALLGKNIWEIFPTGKNTESYQKIQQALEDRRANHYESYSEYLDQWLSIHLYPTEQGISVYFQDITERKQAETVLKQYTKELERSNRDLQDFAFVASHDLQEPLRKIEALGDMILTGAANLNEQQRDQLERMRNSAGRMRSMVNGLLQLSRLTTQARPFQPVNLQETAQEVLSDLELQIKRTAGRVAIGELPVIEADALQMRQLFQNLIGNALKFQPPGGRPEVKVYTSQSAPDRVHIMFQDNGIGFDQEQVGRMFQPFKRLVGKSEYEGSGIGLAIARRIAERHGGEISALGEAGKGATFIVILPVKHKDARP